LSKKFSERWEGRRTGLFPAPRSLRPRIEYAIGRVELQIKRIDNQIDRYAERDAYLFEKLVKAHETHDGSRMGILANELAEIRKHRGLLMNAKISLENVALRLRTLSEFGAFVSSVSPVVENLEGIRTRISRILPTVGNELESIETKLVNLATNTGQTSGTRFDFDVSSENAEKIMEEAAMIAENQMKKKLPEIPSDETS